MNCAKHTDVTAVAYCRTCGKALCANCTRNVQGTIFCEDCLAARVHQASSPRPALHAVAASAEGSPGLAAMLGFIPGVGAMYNGQFMKGFLHAMAFVCLIALANSVGPITVPLFFALEFYMVFDAYSTAKALKYGLPIPDPLGLNRMFGSNDPYLGARINAAGERLGEKLSEGFDRNATAQSYVATPVATAEPYVEPEHISRVPVGAYWLIGLGLLFLLGNVGWLRFDWINHSWPVILIVIGVWLFIRRYRSAEQ